MEDSFTDLSLHPSVNVNDGSQEISGFEEQDVKMSDADSENKPVPAMMMVKSSNRQANLNPKLEAVMPHEPSVSNHL